MNESGNKVDFARKMYEQDASLGMLGISITHLSEGKAEGEMVVTAAMCNGHRIVQGGFLFTFADALFAGACNASAGAPTVTAQGSIHFIAPAFEGDLLRGVAVEQRKWGRNGITDVAIYRDDEVIAEFRGTARTIARTL